LNPEGAVMTLPASSSVRTRQFELIRTNSMWTINGTTWDRIVESNYTYVDADPVHNTAEIWEIRNTSGGWFHPTHIHLVDFRILDRNGAPPRPYEVGPKDVVYVGENEVVRVLMRFEGVGRYMVHCHNLIHEDHDMMTQFEVRPTDGDPGPGDDPLGKRCKDLPEEPGF
jgi:spore coat protein A, manganese oxidase